jgi:hypothetical protein
MELRYALQIDQAVSTANGLVSHDRPIKMKVSSALKREELDRAGRRCGVFLRQPVSSGMVGVGQSPLDHLDSASAMLNTIQ